MHTLSTLTKEPLLCTRGDHNIGSDSSRERNPKPILLDFLYVPPTQERASSQAMGCLAGATTAGATNGAAEQQLFFVP